MKTTASIKSIVSIKIHEKPQCPLSVAERSSVQPTLPVSGVHCDSVCSDPTGLQAGIHLPQPRQRSPVLSGYRRLSRQRQPSRARCPKTVEKIPPHSTK